MKEIIFDKKENANTAPTKIPAGLTRVPMKVPMRTFGGDVAHLVEEKGITKTQVIMAEESRRESRGEERTSHGDDSQLTRIIFLLLVVFTFAVGVGLYVLIGTKPKPKMEEVKTTAPIPASDVSINVTNKPREQIIADLAAAFGKTSFSGTSSSTIHFTTIDARKSVQDATASEFLNAVLQGPMPAMLRRALTDAIVFHINTESVSLPPTVSLEWNVRSYPNAFAGMLEWEKNMGRSLISILDPKLSRSIVSSVEGKTFIDKRIAGVDARVLQTDEGRVVLAYVFLNKEYLIIAANDRILATLINASSTPISN